MSKKEQKERIFREIVNELNLTSQLRGDKNGKNKKNKRRQKP